MSIGKAIKIARIKKGFRLKELAKVLGVTPGAVCNWEANINKPLLEMYFKMREIIPVEEEIRRRLGDTIFGVDQKTLPEVVGELLEKHALQVTAVDTLTGGVLTGRMQSDARSKAAFTAAIFSSPEEAFDKMDITAPNDAESAEAAVIELTRRLSRPNTLGVCIIGPVKTDSIEKEALIAIAHKGQVNLSHYHRVYKGQTDREWLAAQALNRIWRRLR